MIKVGMGSADRRVHDAPAAAPITGKKHETTSEKYLIDMLKLSKGGSTFILHGRGIQLAKHFHNCLPCLVTCPMTCFLKLEAGGCETCVGLIICMSSDVSKRGNTAHAGSPLFSPAIVLTG